MAFICFFLIFNEVIRGYDLHSDLARGLVHNDSIIAGSTSDGDRFLSNYPDDYAAIYLNGKALGKPVIFLLHKRFCIRFYIVTGKPFLAQCDTNTGGSGWTMFQKREDFVPLEDFYRR